MEFREGFFLIFTILGGLALFLFGMGIMTDGLRAAAGERLRGIIYRGTGNRVAGLGLGTGLGFLMHSSATTVMTVGFINAGLLSLAQSIPVFMGANIGTTLSMQLISFRLTDYALVAVACGFLLHMAAPSPLLRNLGRAVLGFGLLFKGMELMSGAIEPHRDTLLPVLAHFDGSTLGGMLLGTLAAWLFTAVVQSSGATIGMTFVLISAGVFTSLQQAYPIVLGAHLGTTTTALLASLGCGIEARRGAVANLGFNVFNVLLGILAAPLFIRAMEWTSDDVVRQTANLHTAIMVAAAVIILPFTQHISGWIRAVTPSRQTIAQSSFLDPNILDRPESALAAVMRESRRSLHILAASLREARAHFEDSRQRRTPRVIHANEQAINEIREAVRSYLTRLTDRYLSRRQRLLAQYLTHIAVDIERIGDHIVHVVDLSARQHKAPLAAYDADMRAALLEIFGKTENVLEATIHSLDPDKATFPAAADAIEKARDAFVNRSQEIRQEVNDRVACHEVQAIAGLFFSNHVLSFERLVRHCKMIAREEQQPFFALKPAKLDRIEPPAGVKTRPKKKKE
ncbi:MAG: Na/Pi cotransporter family protein [Opitutales bacterium]|nr:Na/Pi cotransporter family protein [Opitutales bacterium]